jgi:hypothetical protein
MADWELIIRGNISLLWIIETMKPENRNRTVSEILKHFKNNYENTDPLNDGTLFMAAYLLFLYPQESEFNNIDKSKIDTSDFLIIKNENIKNKIIDSSYIVGRLRNSIAHGHFSIDSEKITFEDWVPNKNNRKPNYFKTEIHQKKFGDFINNFMLMVKEQTFNKG